MSLPSVQKKLTETSPAAASTVASTGSIGGLASFDTLTIVATIQGATGGTLDVRLIDSFDGGVTWLELARFTQLAAAAAAITYSVTCVLDSTVTQIARSTTAASAIGSLAAGTIRPGHWGDTIKAVFTAGASTSAGAAQTIEIFGNNARR